VCLDPGAEPGEGVDHGLAGVFVGPGLGEASIFTNCVMTEALRRPIMSV
jgi:hypothetical protein